MLLSNLFYSSSYAALIVISNQKGATVQITCRNNAPSINCQAIWHAYSFQENISILSQGSPLALLQGIFPSPFYLQIQEFQWVMWSENFSQAVNWFPQHCSTAVTLQSQHSNCSVQKPLLPWRKQLFSLFHPLKLSSNMRPFLKYFRFIYWPYWVPKLDWS